MKLPFFIVLLISHTLSADPFRLIKKESLTESSPTLLVIGGIHGNEPGSYFATALLAQYYQIERGNVWIVPNLNQPSIQNDNRGIYGDMNRKFAEINPNDPDYDAVDQIKKIILSPEVGLILNLHDGHGFYRKEYQNTIFNPNSWGQTCVIDQGILEGPHPFGNLNDIASKVSQLLNENLIENHHYFDVRNTNTRFDDEAMKHSLTYFAVINNKPAFAIETSKNLPTLHHKVFYQLRAIESYMQIMGIQFKTSLILSPEEIEKILKNDGNLTINNDFYLNLKDLKNTLSFIPLQSKNNDFKFSHPLGSFRKNHSGYDLFIGNKKISTLIPSYHLKENCSTYISLFIDGKHEHIPFASDFFVNADFEIINNDPNIRVNIIGYTNSKVKDESNIRIKLSDIDTKYAIDSHKKSYRIEFYRQNCFCGMVLVHFK
ncbi:M99 family carboxypeptidase catalytic domain-containing protein [Sulfuricurvum sp.]|uniref:M99 family carboxypeptidase catalytic domain-containing protein n=1 Tax=Sulfuricurvum sp. TaxID=2025608 RepID=UPI002627A759|nr:M99 family carboxypeptidase catalytic domain-containing protein [Sulfuricurvum sp.]MDD2780147.1 M99 family carboxypeptidase catalytic domain-containing protein [Sulfuricurvum sp.]